MDEIFWKCLLFSFHGRFSRVFFTIFLSCLLNDEISVKKKRKKNSIIHVCRYWWKNSRFMTTTLTYTHNVFENRPPLPPPHNIGRKKMWNFSNAYLCTYFPMKNLIFRSFDYHRNLTRKTSPNELFSILHV